MGQLSAWGFGGFQAFRGCWGYHLGLFSQWVHNWLTSKWVISPSKFPRKRVHLQRNFDLGVLSKSGEFYPLWRRFWSRAVVPAGGAAKAPMQACSQPWLRRFWNPFRGCFQGYRFESPLSFAIVLCTSATSMKCQFPSSAEVTGLHLEKPIHLRVIQ